MRTNTPALVLVAASTALVGLVSGACGGGESNPVTPESATSASATSEPAPAATPSAEAPAATASAPVASSEPTPQPAASSAAPPPPPAIDTAGQVYKFDEEPISASANEKMTPKFQLAPPPPNAPFTPENVRMAIRVNSKAVHACYVKTLKKTAGASGLVIVHFVVDKTGKAEKAEVGSSTVNDPALGTCVLGAVKGTKFPRPANPPAQVDYPYNFTPAGG
jgi:TonB family protein